MRGECGDGNAGTATALKRCMLSSANKWAPARVLPKHNQIQRCVNRVHALVDQMRNGQEKEALPTLEGLWANLKAKPGEMMAGTPRGRTRRNSATMRLDKQTGLPGVSRRDASAELLP